MWGGSEPDPGGTDNTSPPTNNQELNDLKDQFEQQQVLIAQLKEMLRKTEQTTVTQEKLEEYANTLTRMKARAKKKGSEGDKFEGTSETSGNEKIQLLRQQMEENKLKLAERKKFQKGIEETVTQLKAQFDDSQHYINQSLNVSLNESKVETYSINSSAEELFNLLLTKDKKLGDLNVKIHKLEANVIDLQENVKEKDSVIDARTKAITLMTESLSKKGKTTLDALDDTKEQMRKMQENFVSLEIEMNAKKRRLMNELEEKVEEIERLNETNYALEKTCEMQQVEIGNLNELLEKSKESGGEIETLNTRIKELEKLNLDLQQTKTTPQKGKKGKRNQKGAVETASVDQEKLKYEAIISELNLTIEELNLKLQTVETSRAGATNESEEITVLKKQVEESNKNAIKMKAQHKARVKELNKKMDELKNNEGAKELIKLQEENTKLNERIESLQEEIVKLKGCLDASSEELESKLQSLTESLEEKNNLIRDLEKQVAEVNQRETLPPTKSQVESEITSIHLEEQNDRLEAEKLELQREKDNITAEKDALLEKLDCLNKEKQELINKLDSYMQENMDLIDKLEKLSTEKVSSAESIEIVEGLTQQEKLELEAYQKSIIKTSQENLAENQELNESVNQLTEETSDLLRKIELFTEERREVMDKMEALASDNSHLLTKIQEVENNRDILSETYEQLQNEKEELEGKFEQETKRIEELESALEELRKENETLQANLNEIRLGKEVEENVKFEHVLPLETTPTNQSDLLDNIEEYKQLTEIQRVEIQELKLEVLAHQDLNVQLTTLEAKYEGLLSENEALSKKLKEKSESVHEKDSVLETELIEARSRIQTLEEKLISNLTEVEDYKTILEQNKEELIASSDKIFQLNIEATTREAEIKDLNSYISQLQETIAQLENVRIKEQDETLELMSNQLQELKVLLNENIKQIEVYETELEQNTKTISNLNIQLSELNGKMDEMEDELQVKDVEIARLFEEKQNKEQTIANLSDELKYKEENFHKTCSELKDKYLALHTKIEQNADSLQNIKNPSTQIQDLETKNKEQLEKMKKIAANLKRKTVAYQELEEKYKTNSEKWETESKEKSHLEEIVETKERELTELKSKFRSLTEQLQELEKAFAPLEHNLNECNNKNDNLKSENDSLRNSINNYELQLGDYARAREMYQSYESNNLNVEISEKNYVIENLQQQLDSCNYNAEVHSNAMGAKIQELEMVVESQDNEIGKYRERITKLEEGLSLMEEGRLLLEQKTFDLDEQLREKSNSFEEVSQTEDMLEKRLASLKAHDEKIQKCLNETKYENEHLLENNRLLIEENNRLEMQVAEYHSLDVSALKEKLSNYCKENLELKDSLDHLNDQHEVLRATHEKKKEEVETLESELQGELERLDDQRRNLSNQCEQLQDELKRQWETQQSMQQQIDEYKQKIEQQQTDFDALMSEYDNVDKQNKTNLCVIEQLQAASKDELTKYQDLLSEKNVEILNYQNELKNKEKEIDEAPSVADVTDSQNISTFVWPTSSNDDPFDFIQQQQPQRVETSVVEASPAKRPQRDDGKEELLKKIKTLEFMLYNIEQEKDDVLLQCQSLTNEITRLVYERQNTQTLEEEICSPDAAVLTGDERQELKDVEFALTNVSHQEEIVTATSAYLCYQPDSVEAQVVAPQDTSLSQTDAQELHRLEFEQCKPREESVRLYPVEEEPVLFKPEYLCYEDDKKKKKKKSLQVESQVVLPEDTELSLEEGKKLRDVEFESADGAKTSVEAVVKRKSAYLCHPDEAQASASTTSNLDIFDDNDDGWGCSMDELKLEEDHRQKMDAMSINRTLKTQVEELDEKVRVLQLERERHLEEIKQGQIKSGKLIKKLKEFKTLNERLNSDLKKSDGFGDLNDTIVEELKSQIVQLEKKIKENLSELEKEKMDKVNLLKKVETLQTTNDRFNELKEKQEVEIMSFKRQNNELTSKLEQFEWGKEGFDSPKRDPNVPKANLGEDDKKLQELLDTIKELTLDNEELQAMLEEQRNLRVKAERAKSVEPILENMKTEAEYTTVLNEKVLLQQDLIFKTEEKKSLEIELESLRQNYNELQLKLETEKQQFELSAQSLTQQMQSLQIDNENLAQEVQDSSRVFSKVVDLEKENSDLKVLQDELQEHRERVSWLEKENSDLKALMDDLKEYQANVSRLEKEKSDLERVLQEKVEENQNLFTSIGELQQKVVALEAQNEDLNKKVESQSSEVATVTKQLEEVVIERNTLVASMQELEVEWNRRVDQRGADIAESWKLHLDVRESEFTQLEGQLRKELTDLESKCNGLVNENNELRKNVDAEIRNEVDKIAALQQQISSREHYINELTNVVQENQSKNDELSSKVVEANDKIATLTAQVEEKVGIVTNLQENVRALQSELDEKQSSFEKLSLTCKDLEESQEERVSLEQRLLDLQQTLTDARAQIENSSQTIDTLNAELQNKQSQIDYFNLRLEVTDQNKDSEIKKYKGEIFDLELKLQAIENSSQTIDTLNAELQNKQSQIDYFNRRLEVTDQNKDSEIKKYKGEIFDLELKLQAIENSSQTIDTLNAELQNKQSQIDYFNRRLEVTDQNKDSEIKKYKGEIFDLELKLQDIENSNDNLEIRNRSLQERNDTNEFEMQQLRSQIGQYEHLLNEKEREYNQNLGATAQENEAAFLEKIQELDATKRRQAEIENHYEELLTANSADLENLRLQLQNEISKCAELTQTLNQKDEIVNELRHHFDLKVQECEEAQRKFYEQNTLQEEENKQVNELRLIIEDQVMKIEDLKHELLERSNDYDSLIAEIDIRKERPENEATQVAVKTESENAEALSNAELDLALYMLHQRDVKCEELTVELIQLLEERDTLQLKLSNALREKEEIRRKLPSSEHDESGVAVLDVSSSGAGASAAIEGGNETTFERAKEAMEVGREGDPLANKLSELKSVGYGRDKTFMDEQQQRRWQQLSLMQQHRDVASLLPAEAAARLVQDANYTLSRDVQSPSKVLLNWLWGKSTPKVNDI